MYQKSGSRTSNLRLVVNRSAADKILVCPLFGDHCMEIRKWAGALDFRRGLRSTNPSFIPNLDRKMLAQVKRYTRIVPECGTHAT